ncbi:conserved hypothetical protein (plasmid) [Trichormus variabilis ATCC 29413]|uniref:Uncharacterized protein n=2 Tax=Anabaena variabilis TaxID=264691 RepID=Q3M2P6_TRIV2|nr:MULTISPECIES: hypothetical protein [Nostocaceae]ABA24740.1 conserved hypothetical protein [Trichormus variabilis ATCC 29413]MBC1217876.1 hypothetical protein [Trichormus variabilis ARAD]MBC1259181.1 hypothetical protein [Trichormus variabilis V5]MBC1270752.1 hypothetical protein [Trichormus variabilis FSR]MBC1305662.1 hypothetical protein [Trichormus variabilis N2B]
MQSNLVSETITTINRDSGLSQNQMAYRLALMMERYPPSSIQSTPALDPTERSNIMAEMKNTLSLSHNARSNEDYRQSLKEKYLKEYAQKFGLNKPEQIPNMDNSTRVKNLIAEKKKTFLQEILQSKERKLPLVNNQTFTPKDNENHEEAKKSLIPALMNILVTKGQDTVGGRIYEGISYRLNLMMREGMQRLVIWRKSDNQSAFSAYKVDAKEEYKILHNNLSPEETQKLINFDMRVQQQQQQLPSPPQQQQNDRSPDGPELE